MTAERWQQIKATFHAVCERPPAERRQFLQEVCAGDEELRQEVESLLATDDRAGSFINRPLLGQSATQAGTEPAQRELAERPELAVGQMIRHYRIERQLGAGGMGVVYLATDTELGRFAALKLLPPHLTRDGVRVHRFRQEARAASALNHPNIVTIYEVSEASLPDGSEHFIAAEFVDGLTLRELYQGGSPQEGTTISPRSGMPLGAALDLLIQVAGALAAAHEAGIIHRDIKPENIMRRPDGIVKVLDFGLAKLTEQTMRPAQAQFERVITQPGIVMGTVSYMSPEQARGFEVDARSDLFSLGVVMYELLTGRAPFEGGTTGDVLSQLLTRDPLPLARHVAKLPEPLQKIVGCALAKPVEQRYQTAREFGEDLKRLKEELEFAAKLTGKSGSRDDILTMTVGVQTASGQTPFNTREAVGQATAISPRAANTSTKAFAALIGSLRRHRKAAMLAALATIVALVIWWLVPRGQALDSVAVIPYVNETGDAQLDYLSDGLTENMIDSLSRLPPLTVMASSTVFVYKGREIDPRQLGKTLKIGAVITGHVRRQGNQFSVQIELYRTADGSRLWGERYQGPLTSLLAVQEDVSREIAGNLRVRLTGEGNQQSAQRHTPNSEAYELYMTGRHHWSRRSGEGIRKSIESYQRALKIDPGYALAQVGLADAYSTLGSYRLMPPQEAFPLARTAAEQALKLDPQLAEAHASLGKILTDYGWDWTSSETEFKTALALNPNCANAHHWYSTLLAHMGRFDEAIREVRIAQKLDLLSPATNMQVGNVLYRARRYDEAIAALHETLDLDPKFLSARIYLAMCYMMKTRYADAVAELETGLASLPNSPEFVAMLGYAHGLAGQSDLARRDLAKLNELSRGIYVPSAAYVGIYVGLGEMDTAFAWLEKSYEDRSPLIRGLKTDPIFDGMRSDARFAALLKRAGLDR